MKNIKLLEEICQIPGAPGFEYSIRQFIKKELKGLVDGVETDSMGNLIALKKGKKSSQKIVVAAHMDEIGFIVNHIDDNGFIRFLPLGGFDPKTLTSQRVLIHGKKAIMGVMGCKPIHLMSAEEVRKPMKLSDYFIDTGMNKKEVEKEISVGNSITRVSEFNCIGNCVCTKSLDNRVSVFVLIETLRAMKMKKIKPAFDFYAVFTVQEEVGLRGAQVAALKIQADFSIALDTTIAFDVPNSSPQEQCTRLGKGAGIKVMDTSVICDQRMVQFMKNIAKASKIKNQLELMAGGGTDTASLQKMVAGGSIAGAISIPTRHIHQTIEMASCDDIQSAIQLLTQSVIKIDKYDWKKW